MTTLDRYRMPEPPWQDPHFELLKPQRPRETSRMPVTDFPTLSILFAVAVGLLVFIFMLCWAITRQLFRIERLLADMASRDDPEPSAPSQAETQAGGAFETFLSEHPARRLLPKSEQFAAYRKWRQEKGLNWSGSV